MKNLKTFIEKSNIEAKLIRSVVRQIGGWEEFKDRAQDVYNYGAAGGFAGFTYYDDTVAFTKRNKVGIEAMLKDLADSVGESFADCLRGFNCLKISGQEAAEGFYNHRSDDRTQVYNALAWFALEEVCRAYCDLLEIR